MDNKAERIKIMKEIAQEAGRKAKQTQQQRENEGIAQFFADFVNALMEAGFERAEAIDILKATIAAGGSTL